VEVKRLTFHGFARIIFV